MRPDLDATNDAELSKDDVTTVLLLEAVFSTPVYVSSAAGTTVPFDGDDYLGVGSLGWIEGPSESEDVVPNAIRIGLSGVQDQDLQDALNAGRYGDLIIVRKGLLGRDLRLVSTPWIQGSAFYEFATASLGPTNQIVITAQNALAVYDEFDGSRWNNEDQRQRFAGDTGGSFTANAIERRLRWGDRPTNLGSSRPFHDPSERDQVDSGVPI